MLNDSDSKKLDRALEEFKEMFENLYFRVCDNCGLEFCWIGHEEDSDICGNCSVGE